MSEFSTNITIKGLKRDLFAAMIALQEYVKGKNDISISCPCCSSVVNEKYKSLFIEENTTAEEIASFAKELQEVATLDVEAGGPWGRFGSLDEVNLFEDISIVAPSCHLKGWMGGIGPGGEDYYVDYDDDDGEEAVITPAACTEDEFGLAELFDEMLTSSAQFPEAVNVAADRIREELDWDSD